MANRSTELKGIMPIASQTALIFAKNPEARERAEGQLLTVHYPSSRNSYHELRPPSVSHKCAIPCLITP